MICVCHISFILKDCAGHQELDDLLLQGVHAHVDLLRGMVGVYDVGPEHFKSPSEAQIA